jgi:DNA-binding protein HU-beta
MNKAELIDVIAQAADISKAAAERALDGFIDGVTKSLSDGSPVALVGFGTFDVSERKERKGRNPLTGAELTIPAARVAKFKAGKKLKDAVNK